ncbi:unnamed protein product [Cuscuta campestris]|uniref:Remorin C-terminal domain-containing protein n=1 Tax=Cuscuta campestris TaxID=132261 RepID=A0A484LW32_9ASTE|nr:unnamed protein product [Cuscuta campestris]
MSQNPVCKLNLNETTEFVRSAFPAAQRSSLTKKSVEAPSTPGRPIFSFSIGNFSRKSVPSKWDDAEKWVANGSSCHDSPSHPHGFKYCNGVKPTEAAEEDDDEKHSMASVGRSSSKPDKFARELGSVGEKLMKCCAMPNEFKVDPELRDIGTSMTPMGSSAPSKCHSPMTIASPNGHNTPADRSGPLPPSTSTSASATDVIMQLLQERHFSKLQLATMQHDSVKSNWSTLDEEEDDVSKSLRHFEASNECQGLTISKPRSYPWEGEVSKCCQRYQREEAQIRAWVNLQSAKAEAQSKKLEVKIQKMISKKEEKLMKRLAMVRRKAEEWRSAAQVQHREQMHKLFCDFCPVVNCNECYSFIVSLISRIFGLTTEGELEMK